MPVAESFGTLLRSYRGRAALTQEELAERAGLHAQEISKLERGVVRTPRSTTVEYLAVALRLDAEERAGLAAAARGESLSSAPLVGKADAESILASMPTDSLPPRAPLPAGSRMPLAPNPLFVGRGEELLQVAAALRGADARVALGQVVASTGLGGLGKTQLAVELVHRYGRFFTGGVYWLSFASADEIPLQVAACAEPGLEARPLEERVRRVKDAWQSAAPRLLVFDNCEEESLLEAWRPSSGGCRILVTSRRSHWSPTLDVTVLPLDVLPRPDGVTLLHSYRPDLTPGDRGLDAIAAEVGDLPLALHLAGSYLRAYRAEVGLDEYVAELRQAEVIDHTSLLGEGLDDSVSPTHHVQGVAQTFALCIGRLDPERTVDRVAIALLARMAWMAPGEPVPGELLSRTLGGVEPRRRADGLLRLGAVGLVDGGDEWPRLHRLLAQFVRQAGVDCDAQPAVDRALIACGDDAHQRLLTGSALAAVIPHMVDVAGAAIRSARDDRLVVGLCIATGRALYSAGDLRAAGPWFERSLVVQERMLGPDHPDTAESLNNLGFLLHDQGKLVAARSLYERALAIRERVRGPNHPDTAASLSHLAGLLWQEGDVAAARPLLERALDIWERVLGPDHPDTPKGLGNLAAVLLDQGELAAAKSLYQRSLDIRERVLGADHPDTANSLNGLARVLHAQGELNAARPLSERALAIRKRALGLDHPLTARSLNDLAALLRDQGDPTAAHPLFERALAIRERVFGPDHPDTVATTRALEELAAERHGAGEAEP